MEDFPCTGCSLCCRSLSFIIQTAKQGNPESVFYKAAKAFPYSWDESGCCVMLKNNLCSVYDNRPLLCNVKQLGSLYAAETGMALSDVYSLNARICNSLIADADLDKSFMIDPDQFK
jgi:Fe-S-cluster containining protein